MLIQLCYCSKYKSGGLTLIEDIRDILITAKQFNFQHDIHGTLYYADGSFLQCLEGEETTIRHLYANILKDRRHEHIHLLKIEKINDIRFKKWTMKYVSITDPVKSLMNDLHFDHFTPERLTETQLDQIVDILYLENEQEAYSAGPSTKRFHYSHYF
ncbi:MULTISPECIES: BLUF domain-containing protein [unclassified Acinetobacter]|uniref:BLUF domain-containing protein n=1 Tax=unclassified Acinetobacter TaxID=196816 RepID=UPI002934BA92|nr:MULTISPECIES: BLUF domain-containing protein [unclassified Acinetobacter]WOE31907.1 BLUF domain-containing protein [Acinetobacter sp. SAAs470]WOE37374.1 BLUF domain-containing protein [Acinetobacter sp. SAAs474]